MELLFRSRTGLTEPNEGCFEPVGVTRHPGV